MAQGVPDRLMTGIFLTFRHYEGGSSSSKSTGRLYPRRNPWYSLSEAESTSGHMVLSGVRRKKIPSDTTGNRSRDLPTSSATPGPRLMPVLFYIYRGADKSLARLTSRCILFDGEIISFDASLVLYIYIYIYTRGADKSLARPTSQCILFDGENISFDASLVLYTYI